MIEVTYSAETKTYNIIGAKGQIENLTNGYLNYLRVTGKSPNTVRTYAYHLCLWLRYCDEKNIDCLTIYGTKDSRPVDMFTDYMRWLQYTDLHQGIIHLSKEEAERSNRTINQIMSAVLSFYSYLSSNNVLPELPVYRTQRVNGAYKSFLSEMYHHSVTAESSILKKPEEPHKMEYITREQYREMLQHCYLLRDKLILALMFEGGLRLGEVLGVHICDLKQLEDGIVQIVSRENNENGARVKRMAEGVIKLPDYVITGLLELLCKDLEQYDSEYLFVAFSGPRKGKALKPDSVEKLFNRISREMNFEIHPHMLRHGFATEKLACGWTLMDIQAYLRHKSIRTTEIYAFYSDELKIRKMQSFFSNNEEKMKEVANAIKGIKRGTDQQIPVHWYVPNYRSD